MGGARRPALHQGLRGQRPKRAQDLHQKPSEGPSPGQWSIRGVCPGMGTEASEGSAGSRGADMRLRCEALPTGGRVPCYTPVSPALTRPPLTDAERRSLSHLLLVHFLAVPRALHALSQQAPTEECMCSQHGEARCLCWPVPGPSPCVWGGRPAGGPTCHISLVHLEVFHTLWEGRAWQDHLQIRLLSLNLLPQPNTFPLL